jgi:hypothetical protein
METWTYGHIDTWIWRHCHINMEKWIGRHGHGDMDLGTWTWGHEHGDMDMRQGHETWTRHGHETWTWRYKIKILDILTKLKRKTETRAIFLNPFTVCSSCNRKLAVCPLVEEKQAEVIYWQTD